MPCTNVFFLLNLDFVLQKLHKLKKHVLSQNQKLPNEGFNNSTNIDIIGIDVDKEAPPMPAKVSHDIIHLVHKDPVGNLPEHSHTLLPYEHKEGKEVYHHQGLESQTCTICGEGFDFMTALAQHYMHQHKEYEHNMKNYGLNLT